jgi:hypothetical protein
MPNGIRTIALFAVGLVVLTLAPTTAGAGESVKVLRTLSFSDAAKTRDKVKEQCKIQTDVPRYIEDYSDIVQLVAGPLGKSGRVLELTIVDARAAGFGFYSGGKWVSVDGVLTEDGREIGSFQAKRFTIGYFNMTSCGAARRCSKAVGKDIAKWLENPEMHSRLGSLD